MGRNPMTDAPTSATITDIRDLRSFRPGRLGKWDKVIVYSLGPNINYTVVLDAETYTPEAGLAAVKRDAGDRLKIIGQTVTL